METRVLEVFQFFSLYVAIAQNLIALTPVRTVVAEADGSDEPVVTTDIGAAIWTMEVVATEAGMELELEPEAAEDEDGRGSVAWAPNLAHAFFHLHCVHQRSRCSNPNTLRHFLPSRTRFVGDFPSPDDKEVAGLRAGGLIKMNLLPETPVVDRGAIAIGIEDWFGRLLERSDCCCC